jgi:cytochrome c-type biogenesis protein CcmH/NrfG
VHAGADWDWEMPVVTIAALVSAASLLLAARSSQARRVSRGFRLSLLAVIALLAVFEFAGLVANSALVAARDAAGAGERQRQVDEARKAMRWAPWSSEPWELLGEAQFAAGGAGAARQSFGRAIEKDRYNWQLWFDLALASDGAAQKRALAEARRLNPLSVEVAQLRSALAAGKHKRS